MTVPWTLIGDGNICAARRSSPLMVHHRVRQFGRQSSGIVPDDFQFERLGDRIGRRATASNSTVFTTRVSIHTIYDPDLSLHRCVDSSDGSLRA